MDDPTQALQAAENAVRLATRAVCPDWARSVSDIARLRSKQEEDKKRRDGVLVTDDLLSYLEFHQLTDLVLKNWNQFKPVFDDKKRTEVWFGVLLDVRNAIAHSRHLVEYERELVSGVSKQLRNQVTLYRTRNDAVASHYAVIESAYDHLGWVPTGTVLDMFTRDPTSSPSLPRLEVGDELKFECLGSDPRQRPLEWFVVIAKNREDSIPIGKSEPITMKAEIYNEEHQRVTATVKIADDHVAENVTVTIYVRAGGSTHFRHGGNHELIDACFAYDDAATFAYAVNPPID